MTYIGTYINLNGALQGLIQRRTACLRLRFGLLGYLSLYCLVGSHAGISHQNPKTCRLSILIDCRFNSLIFRWSFRSTM